MTVPPFRQIITQDDGEGVDPHPHDASEISGEATFITVRVNRLLAGTINGKEIVVAGGTDGIIRSDNFVEGATGWRLLGDGTIEVNDAIIRGALINLPSGTAFPGSPSDGDLFYRTDENKAYRFDGTSWHALDFLDDANRVGTSVIATAAIQNLAVETAKINDLAVTEAKINNLAVSTAKIANAAITNAKINDLSADKITAGSLDADRIGVNTLTVDKLVIGSRDNLLEDPGFEQGGQDGKANVDWLIFDEGGATGWSYSLAAERSGDYGLAFNPSGMSSQADITWTNYVAVSSDEEVYFSIWARQGAGTVNNDAFLQWLWYDSAKAFISSDTTVFTPQATYTQHESSKTAPSTAAFVRFRLGVQNDGGDTVHRFDNAYARRKVGTLVIEDQAVDIQRSRDPVHNAALGNTASNVSITTSFTDTASVTHTIPTWVGVATFINLHAVTSITADESHNLLHRTNTGGSPGTTAQFGMTSAAPSTYAHTQGDTHAISAPGSSVTVKGQVQVNSGNNASNNFTISSFLSGIR